ncbi:MFS transporter, DHA1 family, inner membrane transport protein [Janthinobacterium sp. CG_23.3]|uniref:MFS transporter n=1 Tax=unclassified Janthinobacterium TaxID=2610881 RepID=UPI00047703D0|nr:MULTISPECIES: MFS transporter [unclassified Janthinobacterium]MEC5162718.1 DHA1 family inner membrane transport protein [Janthinobacterium sp. CG_S6]
MTTLPLSPGRERALLWLLALTQFTVIMDFMVMMPLAPQLMRAFAISPAAVAGAVSAYAWCAGLSGLFAATYIDRFDRKKLLLSMFCLFTLSNLACAMAPNFHVLVLSRAFAGLTGGVLGSIIMAIIGDIIPAERRGAATGVVMTSFSLAAVAGVPIGVVLAAHFGWASPFYLLVLLSVLIWIGAARVLPALTAHRGAKPATLAQALPNLLALFTVPRHLSAFLLSGLSMAGAMLIIPFISPVIVSNLGVAPADITWIYLAGGAATLFTARRIGVWSDRYGKARVYRWVALFSILPILCMTHLPQLPLLALIAFFPFFMVSISGRNIPLQALMTTIPEPARRGAFLSAGSAVQQLGSGLGAWVGGLTLHTDSAGHIGGYGVNGWVAAALTLLTVWWVGRVQGVAQAPRAVKPA